LAKRLMEPLEIRNQWRRWIFIAATVVLFGVFTLVKHASGLKGLTP